MKQKGNVVVKQGDSLELNSEYIEYSGKTKLAIAKRKVELENNESILRTDSLFLIDKNKKHIIKPQVKSQVKTQ